jgi:Putative lumazine-binding
MPNDDRGKGDEAAVAQTARNYIESWFAADAARMSLALHPELAKRSLDKGALVTLTAEQMIEYTAAGGGAADAAKAEPIEITVDCVDGDLATATVLSGLFTDYLQLVRTDSGWRITNALWKNV